MADGLRTRGHIRKNYEDVDWQDSGDEYLGDSSDDEEWVDDPRADSDDDGPTGAAHSPQSDSESESPSLTPNQQANSSTQPDK